MEDRKQYRRPELVEYGQLAQLTLGSGGAKLDFSFTGDSLTINDDGSCKTRICFGTS